MRKDKTEWAISRLRTMPERLFYSSVVILASSPRAMTYMARQLLNQPDRGGLQSATFHTLRTYLTPVARILNDWSESGFASGSLPPIFQEAQSWLQKQKPTDSTA
jgi:hypothetical protein